MKKHLLFALLPFLFTISSFTSAADDVIIIKTQEVCKNCNKNLAKMVIVENGASREVELLVGLQAPESNKNLVTLSTVLNQYHKAGYKVTASSTSEKDGENVKTTYILTK